jgi:integrase
VPKLTKRAVDAADADPGRRFYVWDADLKGFGLLVLPSGVKTYIFNYRTPEGRARRFTIGKHGSVTPDQARSKAEDLRSAVSAGRDPLGEKEELRAAPTVSAVLDAYLASERFAAKASSTQGIDLGRIERHLKPLLGKKHVHALTPGEVERAFAAIRDGKTAAVVRTRARGKARVTGGEGTAREAIHLLRAVLAWAVPREDRDDEPGRARAVRRLRHARTHPRRHAAYERLFRTLDAMQAEKRIRAPVADAIRLIALTGARRGEVAGLRWAHVDLKRGLVTLPPHAHKTGRKAGKARVIGLPSAAQAIIARQPAGEPDSFVFAPSHGAGPIALSKIWRTVRVEAKLSGRNRPARASTLSRVAYGDGRRRSRRDHDGARAPATVDDNPLSPLGKGRAAGACREGCGAGARGAHRRHVGR